MKNPWLLTSAAALLLLLLTSCRTREGFSLVRTIDWLGSGNYIPTGHTRAHLRSVPHLDRDFRLDPEEMPPIFWDIDRYSQVTIPFLTFYEMPPITELKYGYLFGPPESKRLSWWNLCPFFLFPPLCPCKTMVWEHENYRIEAVVAYPIVFGFVPHLWYWDVKQIRTNPPGFKESGPDEWMKEYGIEELPEEPLEIETQEEFPEGEEKEEAEGLPEGGSLEEVLKGEEVLEGEEAPPAEQPTPKPEGEGEIQKPEGDPEKPLESEKKEGESQESQGEEPLDKSGDEE